jgi:hypothetical protein
LDDASESSDSSNTAAFFVPERFSASLSAMPFQADHPPTSPITTAKFRDNPITPSD